MKYYAVTEDPRELYHYGVKGMKWGQHIFGDKPKSPGYKKAVHKLKAFASNNKRRREERKYENSVMKAQNRIAVTERLYQVDQDKALHDSINKSQKELNKRYKQDNKIRKAQNRLDRKYERNEAKMDKYMEKARQGKLKYGQLSDDQVQRVQERLLLESQARKLGSAEKTWRQQKKEARRAGYLSGITKGTAAAMEEVARAGATYGIQHLVDRKKMKSAAKFEGQTEREKSRAKNKKTHKDINNEIKQEAYEMRVREGEGIIKRNNPFAQTTKAQSKHLREMKENRKLLDSQNNDFNAKYLTEYGFKNENEAIDRHKDLLNAKLMTVQNKYGRDSDEYRSTKKALNEFEKMDKDEQKRAMLSYDTKQSKTEDEEIRKENEAYRIKLEEYKADRQKYKEKMEKYNQIERDYVTDFNKWLSSGAKGKPPIKPYFPKPDEPEPPKMPKHLLSGNNQGGGGRKK